jgi:M6 family metalloprotease-like protein
MHRTTIATLAVLAPAAAKTCVPRGDPFQVVDPQEWVNPDDMTWADYKKPPGTSWNDPAVQGSERNFNIALVTLDYDDLPFAITQAPESTVFGNPQPVVANVAHGDVPGFYRDLLNTPNELNRGHTLHEYWMEDSAGRYGVNLTVFGVYRLPSHSWQYGIDDRMNPGSCPVQGACNRDIRTDGLGLWRKDVGDEVADTFELAFILSAGQDESSTWQEFGEMKFADRDDVPDAFGPPRDPGDNTTLANWATTRYVPWTSWVSAATIWPNAGGGSSTQAESSGMGVYAHELSHLLDIADNYNNPYGTPMVRAYTGPWSMMSRGSFLGPGGPHTRWQIPALLGSSMGSLHTMRDKFQLGLITESKILQLDRTELASSGFVVARITARSVESELMGVRVLLDTDRGPTCSPSEDFQCDGGGWNAFDVEVVDRMGSDSFQADSGVMISKIKDIDRLPFQFVIDANPQDIELIDFQRPDGTDAMITMGDYRQLADALFHAGTRSGSEFEYVDEANALQFYVLKVRRDESGVLSYVVGVRSLEGSGASEFGVELAEGNPIISSDGNNVPTANGVFCSFDLTNSGTYVEGGDHPQGDVSDFVGYDVFRLEAEVSGEGWRVQLPNALLPAQFGETVSAHVAVGAAEDAAEEGVVTLSVVSESDGTVKASAECVVSKE